MTRMKLEQKQLLIPADQVMNEFCYNFANALLEKLKELRDEDRIGGIHKFTDIGGAVSESLSKQISYLYALNVPGDCNDLIKTAEEFLAIFEKTEE